jgi:Predicted nucleic acid-binding protein, contains PIN domain
VIFLPPSLLDTDTLSEFVKGRNPHIVMMDSLYLQQYGHFTFSVVTLYEILRGLKAKKAFVQMTKFLRLCQQSHVLPITIEIAQRAADIYDDLRQKGQPISDADIFIAATALEYGLVLVTNNLSHFQRIPSLIVMSWAT